MLLYGDFTFALFAISLWSYFTQIRLFVLVMEGEFASLLSACFVWYRIKISSLPFTSRTCLNWTVFSQQVLNIVISISFTRFVVELIVGLQHVWLFLCSKSHELDTGIFLYSSTLHRNEYWKHVIHGADATLSHLCEVF